MEESLHVVISVKDFKTIVTHAESMDTVLHAHYSSPGRPLQFAFENPGLICKFTLMTAGDPKGPVDVPEGRKESSSNSLGQQAPGFNTLKQADRRSMAPPSRPEGRRNLQTLGRRATDAPPFADQTTRKTSDSLLMPQEEEDRSWNPSNYDEDENVLAWDTRDSDVSGKEITQ